MRILKARKTDWSEDLIELEDLIMKEYGFIPIETLKREPISRIMNLMKAIEKRYKREASETEKARRKMPARKR